MGMRECEIQNRFLGGMGVSIDCHQGSTGGLSFLYDAASASPQLSPPPSLFLPLPLCFHTPPFSSLLLFLTHTLPHRGCLNPPGELGAEPNSLKKQSSKAQLSKGLCLTMRRWRNPAFWKAHWERISSSLWTSANSGEDREAPTLWAHGYDDNESCVVMHLRNVKLQIFCQFLVKKKKKRVLLKTLWYFFCIRLVLSEDNPLELAANCFGRKYHLWLNSYINFFKLNVHDASQKRSFLQLLTGNQQVNWFFFFLT